MSKSFKVYRTRNGILIEHAQKYYLSDIDWNLFLNRDHLYQEIAKDIQLLSPTEKGEVMIQEDLLAPVEKQEIWGAGVTYYRSREARMEESKDAGGGDFYDRVYQAERPELFFKGTAYRAAGSGEKVRIRKDSKWDVPEPELTLFVNFKGKITGYTIGNDMSSRSIEGQNPLYLPQAKTYDKSAGIGPCVYVPESPLPAETDIVLEIIRSGKTVVQNSVSFNQMKRKPQELVDFLFRECSFEYGCFLMTGTGIIPDDNFTLASGDEIRITIAPIGTLVNYVE